MFAPPQSGAQGKRKGESVLITISHLTKIFEGKGPRVTALEDVNLEIGKGDIYGIIGMSGAGKSTLLRCLTLLEPFPARSCARRAGAWAWCSRATIC